MSYTERHLQETVAIVQKLDVDAIERIVTLLAQIKASAGRDLFLGVGGGAANCSHAVNDFRKLLGIECYTPADNVAELTARINDDGWESAYVEWLKVSRLGLAMRCSCCRWAAAAASTASAATWSRRWTMRARPVRGSSASSAVMAAIPRSWRTQQ